MPETPQAYVARVLGYLGTQDPRKVQANSPAKIASLVRGAPSAKLRQRPAADKWSVGEILAHLVDCEIVYGWRIRQILGAPGTPIQPFDQDAWASAGHYAKRDARESLDQFRALRATNMALLKTLTPEQWAQYGMHAERGQESVRYIVSLIAGHDLNHTRQIEAILRKPKRAPARA